MAEEEFNFNKLLDTLTRVAGIGASLSTIFGDNSVKRTESTRANTPLTQADLEAGRILSPEMMAQIGQQLGTGISRELAQAPGTALPNPYANTRAQLIRELRARMGGGMLGGGGGGWSQGMLGLGDMGGAMNPAKAAKFGIPSGGLGLAGTMGAPPGGSNFLAGAGGTNATNPLANLNIQFTPGKMPEAPSIGRQIGSGVGRLIGGQIIGGIDKAITGAMGASTAGAGLGGLGTLGSAGLSALMKAVGAPAQAAAGMGAISAAALGAGPFAILAAFLAPLFGGMQGGPKPKDIKQDFQLIGSGLDRIGQNLGTGAPIEAKDFTTVGWRMPGGADIQRFLADNETTERDAQGNFIWRNLPIQPVNYGSDRRTGFRILGPSGDPITVPQIVMSPTDYQNLVTSIRQFDRIDRDDRREGTRNRD